MPRRLNSEAGKKLMVTLGTVNLHSGVVSEPIRANVFGALSAEHVLVASARSARIVTIF
jgi:hypothetical protein